MTQTQSEQAVEQIPIPAMPGQMWAGQVFRTLLSSEQLHEYEAALEAEYPPPNPNQPIGAAPGFGLEDEMIWQPDVLPGHITLFTVLLKVFYYAADLAARFQKPRRRSSAKGPLRVLRMVSLISQGGVAKVCQQSVLPMPTDQVQFILWPFNEKKGTTAELQKRPDIERVDRKMQLWPCSYQFKVLRNIVKLARTIRRLRVDLIHLHEPQFSPPVRIAAALAGGVPVLVHLHNDYNIRQGSIHQRMRAMTMHALRRSQLITCSQTIDIAARRWLEPLTREPALIQDGSDDQVEPRVLTDRLPERLAQAAGDRLVVCMMSHLVPHKCIGDFLQGCRILLDQGYPIFVLLMAYGKKKAGRRMRREFGKMFAPAEGEFLYKVPSPQRLMSRIDVGVSTSALEGLGLNILEYQVEGVPVVCSDLFPHREMVEDNETGLLFEPLNIADFVRKMKTVLDDAPLRRRLGERGRASAQTRRWSQTAQQTAQLYRSLVEL